MKTLSILYPQEKIAARVCVCVSGRAVQRMWNKIGEKWKIGVLAFTSSARLESGWNVTTIYLANPPSTELFVHETIHAADYLWDFVKRRKSAKGKDGREFRANMAQSIAASFEKWNKKDNLYLQEDGIWADT